MSDETKENLGVAHYLIASNYHTTEEASRSKPHLTKALALLNVAPLKRKAEVAEILNLIGINLCNAQEFKGSKEKLCQSFALYQQEAKAAADGRSSTDGRSAADGKTESDAKSTSDSQSQPNWQRIVVSKKFEEVHTLTRFYLAQVEGHLKDGKASADHLGATMHRQLIQTTVEWLGEGKADTLDSREWVNNAIQLAGFYINTARYRQAAHVLMAGNAVVSSRWNQAENYDDEAKEESHAMIQRAWGALHLHRLRMAIPEEEFEDTFASLKLGDPGQYPVVEDYKSARTAFLAGKRAFDEALKFFVLDGFVTDHIRILQEMSQLWKGLGRLEEDAARKCKMHKRRINMLTPVLHQISQAAYGQEYQQLSDEIASSYTRILEIKEVMYPHRAEKDREAATAKINKIANMAILYYRLFIRGFHKDFGPDAPEKLDDYLVKHYLQGRFSVARLYTKIVAESTLAICKLNQESLKEYKKVIELHDRYGGCKEFEQELDICREMVSLLPAKIAKWWRAAYANGEIRQ